MPGILLTASLGGVSVPAGAWVLALGPMPVSLLAFARLYGYCTRMAACALAASIVVAVALLPSPCGSGTIRSRSDRHRPHWARAGGPDAG